MPFGISSAPEVFQRRMHMHEVIKGLPGIEVVADDFVVVGSGETQLPRNIWKHSYNVVLRKISS